MHNKIKIRAIEDYPWWTVGDLYDVIEIDYFKGEKWYKILDDNGEVTQLSDIRNANDFIVVK